MARFDASILERLEIEAQYAVYLKRQEADIAHRCARRKDWQFRTTWIIERISGLSNELKQKLEDTPAGNAGAGRSAWKA